MFIIKKSKLIKIVIILIIFFSQTYPLSKNFVQANPIDFPLQPNAEIINRAVTYLLDNQEADGNIGGLTVSAWAAMALNSSERDHITWGNLILYLKEKSTVLDENKATDWERHLMAIVACNKDPKDFGGIDFIEKITDFFDGTQIGDPSILYDDCFGIISLVAAGVPKENVIIQQIKSYILDEQRIDGGWGDVDSTSASIMALICAGQQPDSIEISSALDYLKTKQEIDGGFYSWEQSNTASTAWAVMAINAAGQNPTSNQWEFQGNNPINYLLSLQNEDGSFNWSYDQNAQLLWMTSYVIPALLGKFYPVHSYEPNDENQPPNRPDLPIGPSSGEIGKQYVFKTAGTDPDNDKIQYRFDWDAQGDHDYSDWTPLDSSGKEITLTHTWKKTGTFLIKAQIKDEHNATSPWSDGLSITINENNEDGKSWTGQIRIEGKNNTIWKGSITIKESIIVVKNNVTENLEEHRFSYPSILGAIEEASEKGDFSYKIVFNPNEKIYYVSSIDNVENGWHFFIDLSSKKIYSNSYELKESDHRILIGHLQQTNAKALQISADKTTIKKHEKINAFVKDQNKEFVPDARVYVDDDYLISNDKGFVFFSFKRDGVYYLHAEKEGYIRSDKIQISVIYDIELVKPKKHSLYISNVKIVDNLKNTWIFGPITFEISQSEDIEKVEFYINDILVFVDNETPFRFHLNQRFFFNRVTIEIQPYERDEIKYSINDLIEAINDLLVQHKIGEIILFMQDFIEQINKQKLIAVDSIEMRVIIFNLFPDLNKLFE